MSGTSLTLHRRGVPASYGSLWRLLDAAGISFKKSLFASEQDQPDVARRRVRWVTHQGKLDPQRLVFIDETWAKTNMTRTHGRCARGQRLRAKVPQGRWRTLTFLAALRVDRVTAPCVIDGPINGRSFLAYVEQILVPLPSTISIRPMIADGAGRSSDGALLASPSARPGSGIGSGETTTGTKAGGSVPNGGARRTPDWR